MLQYSEGGSIYLRSGERISGIYSKAKFCKITSVLDGAVGNKEAKDEWLYPREKADFAFPNTATKVVLD